MTRRVAAFVVLLGLLIAVKPSAGAEGIIAFDTVPARPLPRGGTYTESAMQVTSFSDFSSLGDPFGAGGSGWTVVRVGGMDFHMKTTLTIDDRVMAQLKREAARQGRTMSELVETALRGLFQARRTREELPPLPSFHSGGALVDIADREALYHAMEGR